MGIAGREAQEKWTILAEAWRDSGPPAAPSLQDVSNYVGHAPKGGTSVLILGCTPALRNRFLAKSYSVISVDITRKMIDLTTPLVTEAGVDILVQGNWLQIPVCNSSVDIVVGDKVLGNVMPGEWSQMFAEVKRVLRPDGTFLTRASPHGEHLLEPPPRRAFGELVSKWTSYLEMGMKLDAACSGLWEDCMDMSTEHDTPSIGTQQLLRVIPTTKEECLYTAGEDSDSASLVQRFIDNYWPSRDARWSAYTVDGILSASSHHFEYVNAYTASDYPEGNRQPVFHFVRRT